jgi:Na+-translocating ferredoxin:NAD+ oxidoreductase RnfD subunit
MKILGQPVGWMYVLTIILLTALAAAASYASGVFPFPLLAAVIACSVAEILIAGFYFRRTLKIPYSGIITGLIIGCVAPINAPLALILVASLAAILSKFFIKLRSGNIFNPASVGLLIALGIFSMGDAWWVSMNYSVFGLVIFLTPVLILSAYEARRLVLSLSFVVFIIILTLISAHSPAGVLADTEAAALSVNYFFAFLMLPEPKTSPPKNSEQVVYGALIALLYFALSGSGIPYATFSALLLGNAIYALQRSYKNKL